MKLSFAITICNELDEIKKLLPFLIKNKDIQDEIIILYDEKNGSEKVLEYLLGFNLLPNVQTWRSLNWNNNFADWKNILNGYCTGDYIFQLDADEIITLFLLKNLKNIIEINPNVDLYFIPRVNIVNGITQEDINKWGWVTSKSEHHIKEKIINTQSDEYKFLKDNGFIISEKDIISNVKIKYYEPIINWPDQQGRIYRKGLSWEGKVHERIVGFNTVAGFPHEHNFSIDHIKNIDKQRKQNEYYNTI